jgi:O-antigen ligase
VSQELALPLGLGAISVRLLLLALAAALLAAGWVVSPALVLTGVAGIALTAAILRRPLVAFIALAFSVPWTSGTSLPLGGSVASPTEVVVAALTVVWLATCVAERVHPWRGIPWTGFIGLFLLAILLSASQAADIQASVRELLKWIELGVVFLAATRLLRTRQEIAWTAGALVLGGVSQAVLGLAQLALSHGPAAFAAERAFLRAYGSFDQPNPYAGYLNMILPLALALTVCSSGRTRTRYGVAALLIGLALLASQSRGALLAGVIALSIVLAVQFVRFRAALWLAALIGLVTAWGMTLGVTVSPVQRVLDSIGFTGVDFGHVTNANFSAVERVAHWLAGVRMFASHPLLGVGIGNFSTAYPQFHPRGWYAPLGHAHNYYINVAAEAGVAGLVAYVLLTGSALWYSCAATCRARDSLVRAIGLGVVGALIATSLHNVFDVLYVHGTTALIGLLMGLLVAVYRLPSRLQPAGEIASHEDHGSTRTDS